jgi:hypothetical protein
VFSVKYELHSYILFSPLIPLVQQLGYRMHDELIENSIPGKDIRISFSP